MAPEAMAEFNREFAGVAMVTSSGSSSHFMTGDTLIQMMEQLLGAAFAKQRDLLPSFNPAFVEVNLFRRGFVYVETKSYVKPSALLSVLCFCVCMDCTVLSTIDSKLPRGGINMEAGIAFIPLQAWTFLERQGSTSMRRLVRKFQTN